MKILSNFFHWLSTALAPPKKDLKVVFLCVVGATIIWLFNALNKNYTTVITCPVDYKYDQPGLVVVTAPPDRIKVNVSAGGWNLLRRNLLFTWYHLKIDIPDPTGTHYITGASLVSSLTDQMPELNSVNSVETDTLFFDIQHRKDKMLIGKINRKSFSLENSYRIVGPITINPGEFQISGPEKLIDTLPGTFEISLDKDHISKPYSDDISLDYFNSDLVQFNPKEVHVSFNVEKYINKRVEIPVVPVNFPKDSSAYLATSSIFATYDVRKSMEDSVDSGQFIITADFKKAIRKDSIAPILVKSVPRFAEDFKPDTTIVKVVYVRKRRTR